MGCLVGSRPGATYVNGAETVSRDSQGAYVREKVEKDFIRIGLDLDNVPDDAIIIRLVGKVTTGNAAFRLVAPGYAAIYPTDREAPSSCAWQTKAGVCTYVWGLEPLTIAREIEAMGTLQAFDMAA